MTYIQSKFKVLFLYIGQVQYACFKWGAEYVIISWKANFFRKWNWKARNKNSLGLRLYVDFSLNKKRIWTYPKKSGREIFRPTPLAPRRHAYEQSMEEIIVNVVGLKWWFRWVIALFVLLLTTKQLLSNELK